MSLFDLDTDPKLRNQILTYFLSLLCTDIERAKILNLPTGCRIREGAKILAPEKFKCGNNVWIGEGAVLDAQGGLEIGSYTQIGLGVMVWSHSSHKQAVLGKTGKDRSDIIYKPTKIGSNCFIAGPSIIAPGVTIGDGVMISPMSFIDRDIPDGKVVSGNKRERELSNRIQELEDRLYKLEQRL